MLCASGGEFKIMLAAFFDAHVQQNSNRPKIHVKYHINDIADVLHVLACSRLVKYSAMKSYSASLFPSDEATYMWSTPHNVHIPL